MRFKKITASTNAVFGIKTRIYGARLVSAAATSSALLFDAATQAGDEFLQLVVTKGSGEAHPGSDSERYTAKGGFDLLTDLSVTLAGASAVLYVYYE